MNKIKTTITSTGQWLKNHARMHTVVAMVVFTVGLTATLYYWANLQHSVNIDLDAAYTRQVRLIAKNTSTRIALYESFLHGSAGLFSIHNNLTQAEWDQYQQPYNISKQFPDIESIGASRYLTKDQVSAYLDSRYAQGDSNFTIYPAGDRAVYVPVTFNAEFNDNNGKSRGYDAYVDPTRRAAMDLAISTGRPAMSGKLKLVSESRADQSSFILYLPIYAKDMPIDTIAERKAAITGFAYVAADYDSFVDSILSTDQNANIGMTVYDAELPRSTGKVYQSSNFGRIEKEKNALIKSNTVELYGHKWHITVGASPSLLAARERQLPQQALWRGILSCVFFAALVWYLITDRERTYARQKQEEVQTAKDDLLSLASHQLRTPATVVKQYVGMMLQGYAGTLTEQQIGMLTNAYESNERQLDIINQLLYVARLDAGRIKLRKEKTDISKLIRNVAEDHSEAVAERRQRLSFKLPKRPLIVEADPHFLRMVLENLLSNAVKYTPEKGSIIMSARRTPGNIVIKVADTGVGIEVGAQQSVFDKFTRVENELSTDVNGSGVGLYLTKEIVELHSGTIEVNSVLGQGSTFIVRLPIRVLTKHDE